MNKKIAAASLSILSNFLLIALKIVVGIISGSVSIVSEAIHSFMDLLASFIAFFSLRISDKPADSKHPYGHGKFENISGVAEAFLIFIAAGWIIYEAVKKLIHPEPIGSLWIGVGVMAVSALVNILVSRKLYKVAREADSIALEADALHLKTDVYTSAGVAVGLLLILITGYHFLDSVVAILVALLILIEAFQLFLKAYGPLLDTTLPEEEVQAIHQIISGFCDDQFSYHNLRTRKAGNYSYVDFHLNLPSQMTVKEAHDLCDLIEQKIKHHFQLMEVTIHVEYF